MPSYVYRCQLASCNKETEQVQSIKDQPLTKCPSCGAETLRRVPQPIGIAFKGQGFYYNDNRRQ